MPDPKPTPKPRLYKVQSGQNYKGLPAGTVVILTDAEAAASKDIVRELKAGEPGYPAPGTKPYTVQPGRMFKGQPAGAVVHLTEEEFKAANKGDLGPASLMGLHQA